LGARGRGVRKRSKEGGRGREKGWRYKKEEK